jgi:ribosomal protein S27AE
MAIPSPIPFEKKVYRLAAILCDLDEYDRPTVKLPNCPRCGEDELGVIHADLMLCYLCGWQIEGKPSKVLHFQI